MFAMFVSVTIDLESSFNAFSKISFAFWFSPKSLNIIPRLFNASTLLGSIFNAFSKYSLALRSSPTSLKIVPRLLIAAS